MRETSLNRRAPLAGRWVIVCAFLSCAGWGLSALHQLNAFGYAIALAVGAIAAFLSWGTGRTSNGRSPLRRGGLINWKKQKRRFRRVFPRAFMMVAALAILGGILHGPSNYDGLAYRTPRVLHWLAENQWHWIHTEFQRLNTRATAFEWMTAPMFALARTDRFEFLVDSVSFLLLPGLFFGVFRRLGIDRKVAWHWMWLLPTGYCYLLQAGSIANDLFGAFFPLAAVFFALRARETHSARDAWISVLAAALMTSSKTSNLPLLLPWVVAIWPALGAFRKRMAASVIVVLLAAACSFLPTAVLNSWHGAGWSGSLAEPAMSGAGAKWVPALRLGWNCLLLPIQNLEPPINPFAAKWNRQVVKLIPAGLKTKLEQNFEPSQAHVTIEELPVEESAGLGFGVSALLLAGCLISSRQKPVISEAAGGTIKLFAKMFMVACWIAGMVFLTQARWATAARLITPYYGLLVPLLLTCKPQKHAIRARWWKASGLAVFLLAALVLAVSPARPLWPAQTVLTAIERRHPGNQALGRAKTVYTVYANRNDGFAPARAALPPEIRVLGLVTSDDPETSLWRPFGSRRIVHVISSDTAAELKEKGIEYVLVHSKKLPGLLGRSLDQWLPEIGGRIVERIPLQLRAGEEPVEWILVQIGQAQGKKQWPLKHLPIHPNITRPMPPEVKWRKQRPSIGVS